MLNETVARFEGPEKRGSMATVEGWKQACQAQEVVGSRSVPMIRIFNQDLGALRIVYLLPTHSAFQSSTNSSELLESKIRQDPVSH